MALQPHVFSYLRARVRRELDGCDAADDDVAIEATRVLETISDIDAMSHDAGIELMLDFLRRFDEC